MKQEQSDINESNMKGLLERNAKWEKFKVRRRQAIDDYISVKRTQYVVMMVITLVKCM